MTHEKPDKDIDQKVEQGKKKIVVNFKQDVVHFKFDTWQSLQEDVPKFEPPDLNFADRVKLPKENDQGPALCDKK